MVVKELVPVRLVARRARVRVQAMVVLCGVERVGCTGAVVDEWLSQVLRSSKY